MEKRDQTWDKTHEKLYKSFQSGDLTFNESIEQGVLLLGKTKAGKTTSGYYFSGIPLTGISKNGDIKFKAAKEIDNAKIGFDANSQTQIPNHFTVNIKKIKINIYDCPGFVDTFGCHRMISNSYFNYRLYSKIKKVKFILVLSKGDLKDPAAQFVSTIKSFFNNFKKINEIKNQIFAATCLFITKNDESQEKIIQRLQYLNNLKGFLENKLTQAHQQLFHQFINHLIENKKIFTMHLAKQHQNLTIDKSNNVFQQMYQKTKFWQRQRSEKMDMSHINFNVLQEVQAIIHPDFKKKYSALIQYIPFRFKKMITLFCDVLRNFADNISVTNESKDTFLDEIKDFNEKFYTQFQVQKQRDFRQKLRKKMFQGDLTRDQSEQNKDCIYWIRKMKICELIYKKVETISNLNISNISMKFFEDVQSNIMDFLSRMYIIIKKSQRSHYSKFAYCIYRLLQEIKILFILLKDQDVSSTNRKFFQAHVQLQDHISGIFEQSYQKIRVRFVCSYQIEPMLKPLQYKQMMDFYNDTEELVENSKISESERQKFTASKINLSIYSSQYHLSTDSLAEKIKAIQILDESRIILQKKISQAEENIKDSKLMTFLVFKIMNTLGQFFIQLKDFKLAITCFNSVNNVHQAIAAYRKFTESAQSQLSDKIKNSFRGNQKTRFNGKQSSYVKNNTKLFDVYKDFGVYALQHGHEELGFTQLQKAYDIASQHQDLQTIAQLIYKSNRKDAYLLKMADRVFYTQLDPENANRIRALYRDDIGIAIQSSIKQSSVCFLYESTQ